MSTFINVKLITFSKFIKKGKNGSKASKNGGLGKYFKKAKIVKNQFLIFFKKIFALAFKFS
jgi:hypothetical protein